ncbi:hypothetical protein HYFRA_00003340 [Hymenoscyphus fraxineus]|uniref:Uncharacterized protein n=1 Tax=Hymenoscyphus fraxineus TaxID=746836 RepID=A0A9N9KT80_9HELO|nr:hypothetical protein HYFRA_00003340 [Hymenoscyphus fraxineus]
MHCRLANPPLGTREWIHWIHYLWQKSQKPTGRDSSKAGAAASASADSRKAPSEECTEYVMLRPSSELCWASGRTMTHTFTHDPWPDTTGNRQSFPIRRAGFGPPGLHQLNTCTIQISISLDPLTQQKVPLDLQPQS